MTQLVQSGTAATGQPGISRKRVDIAYNTAGQFDEIIRSVGAAGSETEVATGDYSYFDGGGLQEIAYSHSGATLTTPDFPTGLPAGNALSTYSWTYDSAGRVASFTAPEGTFSYGYDNTHQITSADYSVASGYTGYQPDDESWQWDATGNVDDGETIDGNRDTTIGDAQYYYDDDGNIVWESPVGDSSKRLSFYDVRDRLVRVEDYDTNNNLTQMVLFTYDAFDRRVLKRVDSNADGTVDTTKRYVWDGDEVVLVLDESGNVEHWFLHGPGIDQVFADESAADGLLWYLTDNQNTVRDVAKDDGTGTVEVVNHLTYSAFGKILSEENPNNGNSDASGLTPFFAYTGRDWDEDIQLQYNRARWYDPDTGRWRSEDPIRWAAGDENLYRYVGNSPTNFTDPSGMVVQEVENEEGTFFHIDSEYSWLTPWTPAEHIATIFVPKADPRIHPDWSNDLDIYRRLAERIDAGEQIGELSDKLKSARGAAEVTIRLANAPLDTALDLVEFANDPSVSSGLAIILPAGLSKAKKCLRYTDELSTGRLKPGVGGRFHDAVSKTSLRGESLISGTNKLKNAGLVRRKGKHGAWEFADPVTGNVRAEWIPKSGREPAHWHKFEPSGRKDLLNDAGRPVTGTDRAHRIPSNSGTPIGGVGPAAPQPIIR